MIKKLMLILLFLPSVFAGNLEVSYNSVNSANINEFFISSFEVTNLDNINKVVIIREINPNEELKSAIGATIKYFEMEHESVPYLEYTVNLARKGSKTFNIESKFKKLSVDGIARLPEIHVFDNQGNLLYNVLGEEIQLTCKNDNYCNLELGENSLNCPEDCSTGENDNYCDRIQDGFCDPNCLTELDLDCEEGEGITEIPMPERLAPGEILRFDLISISEGFEKESSDARLKERMNNIVTVNDDAGFYFSKGELSILNFFGFLKGIFKKEEFSRVINMDKDILNDKGRTCECEEDQYCSSEEICMNCQCVEIHEPVDTECSSNSQNGVFEIPFGGVWYSDWSCQMFNVVSDGEVNFLDYIVDDVLDCCSSQNEISADHLELCEWSLTDTGTDCIIRFIGKGLEDTYSYGSSWGNSNPWIQDYYYPELCCAGFGACDGIEGGVIGECSPDQIEGISFNDYVLGLTCEDPDCQFIYQPAIHTSEVLNTGTCMDWTILTTSLLRKANVPVLYIFGVAHAYNLAWSDWAGWMFMSYGRFHPAPETGSVYDYCDNTIYCADENSLFDCNPTWINENVFGCEEDGCNGSWGCDSGQYCDDCDGNCEGQCLVETDIGDPFTCGGYTCYEDGDVFTDYCLDESAVPALCGECMDDDWCGVQSSGSICEYGVECGYGGGTCNECVQSCPSPGDLNGDYVPGEPGGFNVLDIVILANCVLADNCADLENGCAGDLNGDGNWNVLDIVTLANCVLAGNCGG